MEELQRHCDEAYVDPEETIEGQEQRIEKYKREGDKDFTEHGRTAEITIDFVLQARAKMSEDKVNGPEDATVSEMLKQSPQENLRHHDMLSGATCGLERGAQLMEDL